MWLDQTTVCNCNRLHLKQTLSVLLQHNPVWVLVVQTGLLTPLNFTWHRLSPLTAFTSGVYFLHNGRQCQWICKFTVPALEAFYVSDIRMLKIKKIPQTCNLLKNDADTFFHPPPPFPYNFCKRNSNGICTASQAYIQLPLLHTAWSSAYSEIGPKVAAATFRDFLCERLWRAFTCAKELRSTAQQYRQTKASTQSRRDSSRFVPWSFLLPWCCLLS